MSANSTLRIAVVGAGRIGKRHIELVVASNSSKLSAVVDPTPQSSDLAAVMGASWYRSLDELLERDRPDGVILATPNNLHVRQALECVRAGVPVLLEKPVATIVADGVRLAGAAQDAGVPVLVGHHRRHSAQLTRARRALSDGVVGTLAGVVATALFFKPDEYFADADWRRRPGGGPVLINLIHAIDDLRYVCGEIQSVHAFASNAIRGFEVEDTVAVGLRFSSGALGTILLSDAAAAPWSWEQTAGEDAMFCRYPDEDCYRLVGTGGSLAVPSLRFWDGGEGPSWQREYASSVLDAERGDPMARQLDHFESVVRGEAEPLVSALDATITLRATLAVTQSALEGRPLELIGPLDD